MVTATCTDGTAMRRLRETTKEERERIWLGQRLQRNVIGVWATETGEQTAVMRGHVDIIATIAFDTLGERVLSTSRDGTVRIWDADTGECLSILPGVSEHDYARMLSEDVVVGHDADDSIKLWRRHRPEWWWGVFWLPASWTSLVLAVALAWSVRRGLRRQKAR